MNFEMEQKQAQSNKENGINGTSHQSRDRNESAKTKGDEGQNLYVVVQPKKKKEVIQISSSQSQAPQRPKENPTPLKQAQNLEKVDKTKKIKKTVFRCQLCKSSGKKSQMKSCINCKHNFHVTCIQNQNQVPKRYICDKCRFQKEQQQRQQQRKLAFEQKQLALELQKTIPKKTQKQRKKQQYTKRLSQFNQRYSYYFQDDQKIKFPIQDKLLIIYRELFQINENPKPKPKSHPLIPSHMIADFLQIENFFSTFKQEIQMISGSLKDIRKNFLYIAMDSNVIDQCYSSMIYCLIKIYLSDIFQKNKTDNVKMLNENCFFTLLTNMNENQDLTENVIVMAAQEIIRYLSTIPSMKKSFEDFIFPVKYNLDSKVYIIVNLIKGLSEVDTFHELVAAKSQRMQNLTKQKGELVNQLKIDEADSLQNKEKIKQFVNVDLELDEQLIKNDQNGGIASTRQLTREKDKNKKKIQKLANQKDKSQRNILQIKAKISQISKTLPFVTSQVVFLGKDRNESQYFFFCNQPNRIYCQYRNFLFDQGQQFYIYEGKQAINELHKSLSLKGIHEKHLADNISSFVKEQIIVQSAPEEEDTTIAEPYTQGIYKQISKDDVIEMVMELQQKFSNYLIMKNLQWGPPLQRENFLANLKIETDVQEIKRMIISLQESFLFVQPISQEQKGKMTVLDSDEEDKSDRKESKKKSPVRLWGINSQRIKKYWMEYLEQCIDFKGIWICANILKNYVDRYVKKKMEFLMQQQKKQEKNQKQRQRHQRHRLRKERQQRQSQKYSRQRSREQRPPRGRRSARLAASQSQQQIVQSLRPNLRQRKKQKFQIDSDIQIQNSPSYQEEYEQDEQSQSDDRCDICGEYGEMICCDTCPKVFHLECLKLKEIPEGQWSCIDCLEKMANSRQTRSRAKHLNKTNKY